MRLIIRFTAAASFAAITLPASAQLAQKLDSIAGADVRAGRSVGIEAAVYKGTEKLLLAAYGKADVETGAALDVGTVTAIGSVTKQFTAVAVLQLRDAGKLSLDDEVTKWFPDLNVAGNRITIRHLMHHTAGIVELSDMQELRAAQLMRNPGLTRDSVYQVIKRYAPAFRPGAMQSYSNTGYWLLGRIVEKASGMTYEDYLESKVLKPAGMMHSLVGEQVKANPARAFGHGVRGGQSGKVPEIVHTATYASGAIYSTPGDMITWMQALHGGKVLPAKSYAEMITPARLADGTPTRYGMALTIAEDSHGLKYIGHNGGGFGYSAESRWYLDGKVAIVVLTNSEPDAITVTTEALAAAVVPAAKAASAFTGDASLLAGTYRVSIGGRASTFVVTSTPSGLAASFNGSAPAPLTLVENWAFRRGGDLLTFTSSVASGPATELHFDTGGDHLILQRGASDAPKNAIDLSPFLGTYESVQPGVTITLAVENDTLKVQTSMGPNKTPLIHKEGTTFWNGREGAPRQLTFNLGPDGKAISITLRADGQPERVIKRIP